MAFTTWTALHTAMLDALASNQWMHESFTYGDHQTRYRSLPEFLQALEYVKREAAAESGTAVRRVYAKPGGRN